MRTLEEVAALLADAREPWWVLGSAAVALHGAAAGPIGDVDVLLEVSEARRIVKRLGLRVRPADSDPLFRSTVIAQWRGAALRVEFMAELQVFDGSGWTGVIPRTRNLVLCGETAIPVPSRAELKTILERFARPKDLRRAAALAHL